MSIDITGLTIRTLSLVLLSLSG